MLLCLAGCGQKKRNANHDIEKNKSSLMDQMDKIAAQEDAKQAEAKKEDSGDVAPASTPSEPAKPEPPASPKPSEKPPA